MLKDVRHSPKWTNPYIGLVALVAAAINRFDEEGRKIMVEAFHHLGRRGGQYMIDEGLVHAGASPHEWGEFSKQLLDLTGIHDHETIEDNEERCVVKVKDCGYLEPFAYLKAPPDICQLIVEWDNGCLETISPGMRRNQPCTIF